MTDTIITSDTQADETTAMPAVESPDMESMAANIAAEQKPVETGRQDGRTAIRGRGRGGDRRGGPRTRAPRERSEFEQSTLDVRRVARVMAGGRRFSFSVTVVIGDKKGRVGVGIGKGADTALAIDKAVRAAKKALITVSLTKDRSIAHEVSAKYASSTVELMPSPGRGLVAGSAVRTVLEYAGVTDVVTKIHTRSKNKLTIARATVAALKSLQTR